MCTLLLVFFVSIITLCLCILLLSCFYLCCNSKYLCAPVILERYKNLLHCLAGGRGGGRGRGEGKGFRGRWPQSQLQCDHCVFLCVTAQVCPHPGRPLYGSMVESRDAFPVGSVVWFQCDRPGYKLSGMCPAEGSFGCHCMGGHVLHAGITPHKAEIGILLYNSD